jgi:hypothetical protein
MSVGGGIFASVSLLKEEKPMMSTIPGMQARQA